MPYIPSDPHEFFTQKGRKIVQEDIINGRYRGETLRQARDFVAFNPEPTKSPIGVIWKVALSVATLGVAVAGLIFKGG